MHAYGDGASGLRAARICAAIPPHLDLEKVDCARAPIVEAIRRFHPHIPAQRRCKSKAAH